VPWKISSPITPLRDREMATKKMSTKEKAKKKMGTKETAKEKMAT